MRFQFDHLPTMLHKRILVICVVTVLCAAMPLISAVKAQVVDPIVHLKADGTPTDEVGIYGASWGDVDDAAYVAGVDGQAFSFDGSGANGGAGNYVRVNNLDNTTLGGSAFSLSAWVNPSSCGQECQIASTSGHNVPFGWELRVEAPTTLTFTYKLTTGAQPAISTTLPLGSWSHVAITWDETTRRAALYINGGPAGSNTELVNMATEAAGELIIGENNDSLFAEPWGPFVGAIDNVCVFGDALDESQIAYLASEEATCNTALPSLTVNTAADSTNAGDGSCTLREAIANANADADLSGGDCHGGSGEDRIFFAIPGAGPHTIVPLTALPNITGPVIIDGTTQPGSSCGATPAEHLLLVELDGSAVTGFVNGLALTGGSNGSTIRGLVINRFTDKGVVINNSHNNTVACNFIGTDTSGNSDLGNAGNGVEMAVATGNVIESNLISGNSGDGVHFEPGGDANTVRGNHIGTNAAGTAALGNTLTGVGFNQAQDNTIGGTSAADRNLISGNANGGMAIVGFSGNPASGNVVLGNYIGTDVLGTSVVPNARDGIRIVSVTSSNVIGGSTPGARNVISGNQVGVKIADAGLDNVVVGNFIGTNAAGDAPLGNTGEGVIVYADNTTIGGTNPGEGNVISGNSAGIYVDGADGTLIAGNFIGTSADGASAVPNGMGIRITSATGTHIGATNSSGAGNVISGNSGTGIGLTGGGTRMYGNVIGRDATNAFALSNQDGITVYAGGSNVIGGLGADSSNVISGNTGDGVALYVDAVNTAVLGNRIWDNGGLGIRFYPGANDGQAAPDIADVSYADGLITVFGRASGLPGEEVRVEFFSNDTCDPSGFGEGRTMLGSATVSMDGAGQASFTSVLTDPGLPVRVTTATATDSDSNTSEFSRCAVPKIGVPTGHVFSIVADALAEPQVLVSDGSGNLLVGLTGSGEIIRVDAQGTVVAPSPVVYGLQRPIGMAKAGQTLYIADAVANAIYAVDLSLLPPGGFDASTLTPLISGLNGPAHLAIGPDGALYVSLTQGLTGEKIIRIDLLTTDQTDHVTFSDTENVNPAGMAFAPNGDLYVALNSPGDVVRIPADSSFPVDGSTLDQVFDGLEAPNALAVGPDGRLFIATRYGIKAGHLGSTVPSDFVTGLAGGAFNHLIFDGVLLSLADGAAGRIVHVTAPKTQVVNAMPLTYTLHTASLDGIGAGGADAARAAFTSWENVAGSAAAFTDGGTTIDAVAGIDGINKVTVDETFPFPPLVLAIAAKTVVFGSTPGEGTIIDADVVVSPEFVNHTQFPIGTETEPGAFDLQSIITHEVGHVIGLVHSGVDDATMYFVLQSGKEARSLTLDDQAWSSYQYPAASPPITGSIAGHIADGVTPGAYVAGGLVLATNALTGEAVHAYSDEKGNYFIPGLPYGDYAVSIAPLSGSLRPAHISAYLQTIANNLTFASEFWNGGDEGADPDIDIPTATVPVTVNGAVSEVDFITNQDKTPPAITGVFPKVDGRPASVNTEVLVSFSEWVDVQTLTLTVSTVLGNIPVDATVELQNAGRLAIFKPTSPLTHATEYEIRVAQGLADGSGNLLAVDYTNTFTTEPPDLASPSVEHVAPADGAIDVYTTESVTIVFSEPMNPATLAAGLVVTDGVSAVPGTIVLELNNSVAKFTPLARLDESTEYTVTIAASVQDASGNLLGTGHESTFTTGIEIVTIDAVGPATNATGISVTTAVLADFSAPIETDDVSFATFQLIDKNDNQVPGAFEWLNQDTRVIFRPSAPLAYDSVYTIILPVGGLHDETTTFESSFTAAGEPQEPAISSVSPLSAATGKTVVINGTGFDPNPANVHVTFNGVTATVTDATLTSITTTVPKTATSGPLVVTIGSIADSVPFEVVEPVEVTDEVVAKVTTDSGTTDGDITPDGTLAFMTNPGTDNVTVINLVDTAVEGTIGVGDNPLKIAITPDGEFAYVTNFKSSTVSVIDVEMREVVDTIQVGLNPIGIAVTPDGTRAYVGEYTGKAVSVIDIDPASGAANQVVARVTTDSGNTDAEISPDGTIILVTGTLGFTILNIDPGSDTYNQVVAKVTTDSGTTGAAISPDGAYGFVTTIAGEILVIDLNASGSSPFQVIAKTTTDAGATDVEMSPDGATLFATNFESSTVTAYSFAATLGGAESGVLASADPITGLAITLTPVDVYTVSLHPEGIVFAPAAGLALVASSGSNDVSIIRFGIQEVLPPAARIAALIDQVEAMVVDKGVNPGLGSALLAHLQLATMKLEKEDSDGAAKQLEFFVRKVEGLMDKSQLDPATGAAMVEEAQAVIDVLRGAAKQGLTDRNEDDTLPTEYALAQNYPNPFNGSTHFEYDVPTERTSERVALRVYDLLGRTVLTLLDEDAAPGRYTVTWDGRRDGGGFVASGVYLVQMQAGSYRQVRKVVVVR